MARFKLTYSNGFEVIEAKDIFAAAAWAQRACKRRYLVPVKIEAVSFEDYYRSVTEQTKGEES